MSELKDKLDAYTQLGLDNRVNSVYSDHKHALCMESIKYVILMYVFEINALQVTSGDIFDLTSSLIEELRMRSQYLDCYLVC